MTIDIRAMLHRVVAEVFDENFAVTDFGYSDDPGLHGVEVSSNLVEGRTAVIRAKYEWADAFIPELNVQANIFDYDDMEEEKAAELRRLCHVMRAYLQGEGEIEKRRRLFRRGTNSVLRIEVDGLEWRLGRHSYVVPDP